MIESGGGIWYEQDPLTSSTAVDWQMSPYLFELNFPMGSNKLNNSSDSEWICYCKHDLIRRHHIMSLCSKEARNGIYGDCLFVVSEKAEHGAVTKDDWMHIVNKHPSLSRLRLARSLSTSCSMRRFMFCCCLDCVSLRWNDKRVLCCSVFDPVWHNNSNTRIIFNQNKLGNLENRRGL